MATPLHNTTNTTFADGNRGFQAGTITGHIKAEFHHYAPERPETPPTSASTILPFDRDPDYVQRGLLLEEIGLKLSRSAARVALVGLGGVGKTQLAVEYAQQLRLQLPETWILWLYASNEARFEQSVRGVLDQLRVRGRKDPKANVFQLLRGWLCDTSKGPWLVILDNADDARVLLGSPSTNTQANESATGALPTEARLDYIPRCHHGRVLVTSRSKDTAQELVYQKDVIAVEPMEEEQALALLCRKLDTWYSEQDAPRLARELDYMPLALTQAAAYICQREGRCSIEQYLGKIGECDISEYSVLNINARDLRRDREANNSIMLTWQISFNHIREVRPSASDLLSLMSFFDRQAILEALLQDRDNSQVQGEEGGSTVDGEASKRKAGERKAEVPVNDAEEYEKDIVVLRNYNLVSSTTDRTIFEMHRLVQLATRRWLKAEERFDRWSSQFIRNLDRAFPNGKFDNWTICQSLFPHAIAALDLKVAGEETTLEQASLFLHSGQYASQRGDYTNGEEMEMRALENRKNVLGEGHPDTLTSMNNLAHTYSRRGRWEEAEKLQMEVMEKRKEVLGEGHPDTLTSMNNLAHTYSRRGRWDEAEKLQVEVMEKRKEVLGEGHPDTLTSMNNLAHTYSRRGRWDEAEKLQMEVMEKMKEVLGEGHPDTLTSMGNLAFTLRALSRRHSALNLITSCADMSQAILGVDHPDTIVASYFKAQWEVGDIEDTSAAEEEEAQIITDDSPGVAEGNTTQDSSAWTQPQFL